MGYTWKGKGYDMDWHEELPGGGVSPDKDWQANAEYAAENNTQNPYTNEAGASPFDHSGLTPGNEAGSTLPPVIGVASQTPAYAKWNLYRGPASGMASMPSNMSLSWQALMNPSRAGSGSANPNDPIVSIEPWLMNPPVSSGVSSGRSAALTLDDVLNHAAVTHADPSAPQDDQVTIEASAPGPRRPALLMPAERQDHSNDLGGSLGALLELLAQGAVPSALR